MSADIEPFERRLDQLELELGHEGQSLFPGSEAPIVARAPGRLDVMGGIGDYSGSLTLELPLAEVKPAATACRPCHEPIAAPGRSRHREAPPSNPAAHQRPATPDRRP